MPDDVFSMADGFKTDLLKNERATSSELLRAYGEIWLRIKSSVDSLTQQIETARSRGETISKSWLFQQDRLKSLQRQVEFEMSRFSDFAAGKITAEQLQAATNGAAQAGQLIATALNGVDENLTASFSTLNTQAIQSIVGFASDGSPLKDLLDTIAPNASQAVADALIQGVALGYNPTKTASAIRDALGGDLARALTISRTETMNAYRDASSQTYQANSDVLDGWVWTASMSERTCPMCIAMSGTIHPLEETLDSHPNCRCVMVPLAKGADPNDIDTGVDWFAQASEETQLSILGPAAFEAFQAGDITLEDLIGIAQSSRWGTSRYTLSLSQVLGQAAATKFRQKAA